MIDKHMYAVVSEQEHSYEFVFGREETIDRGAELDEMYPNEDFTIYYIGHPVGDSNLWDE